MEKTSIASPPRRKRTRRDNGAATTTTTPPPTARSSPGNGQGDIDDGARVVWRDSPAEKQIRVSGTSKLAQQKEVQGFVGRLARASGRQSPLGVTPANGRDRHLLIDSDDEEERKMKRSKSERCEQQSNGSSPTRLEPVTGMAITPPLAGAKAAVSRHILFSPDSETAPTRNRQHSTDEVASAGVSMTMSHRSMTHSSSRGGEPQDELMLLDQLDERLSREIPETAQEPMSRNRQSVGDARPATASTVPGPRSSSAFTTPPRYSGPRSEASVTQVTPPVTVQQKLEFESPDFTEESWELLDQLEFQASQHITNRRNDSQSSQSQIYSQQVLPPAPTPRRLRNSVVVSPTKHTLSPFTEANASVVSALDPTAKNTPLPSVDKRLVFDEAVAAKQDQAGIDDHGTSDARDANFKRLLVLEIDRDYYHRRVTMRLLDEEENHVEIELIEDWFDTIVDAGDTVHVILSEQDRSGFFSQDSSARMRARQDADNANGVQRVVVDNDHHLIIVHPDILVSPTSVTTSFECLRRAVLRETLKVSRPTNPKALLGTLKHELFQSALESNRHDVEFMLEEAQKIVSSNVLQLIESNISEETALRELGIVMQDYRKWLIDSSQGGVQLNQAPGGSSAKILLRHIMAVEEMLWSIKWGLKGATDATVQATFSPHNDRVVIPLELKTGSKAHAGIQHQGQVMLYTLMLSERYQQQCQEGLLMYVPGIETNRISAMACHIRGLIIARNKFATAMARVKAMGSSSSSHHQQALPPMLRRKRDCERCFQIQECVLHHAAVENGSAESSGLEEVFEREVGHLGDTDLAYFRKWNRLIDLEHQNADKNLRALWLQPGTRRERDPMSFCIAKLRLVSDSPAPRGSSGSATMRILQLRRDTRAPTDLASSFLELRFRVDDRVIVSVESIDEKKLLVHVARGRIARITSESIVLETFQSIPSVVASGKSIVGSQYTWRVDKDSIVSSLSRAKENLVKLLVGPAPEEIAEGTAAHLRADLLTDAISQVMPSQAADQVGDLRRRKLIVHLLKPRFRSSKFVELLQRQPQRTSPQGSHADRVDQLHDEFMRLNIDQQRGVMKVLNALDYALILGMPGTGKTSTIAFTVKVLVHLGFSVLISSYTHSAVDNLLLKLLSSKIPMIRVGSSKQVHPALLPYTLEHSIGTETDGGMTVDAVEAQIKEAKVIGSTCLGVNSHVLFSRRRFDFCIVDEATQTTEPVVLGPLRCADTFVLVGDHYQLPPLVANAQAKKEGMDVSLFRRLSEAHPEATQQLSYQYRMNSDIMMLANHLVYADKLKCGSHEVSANQLTLDLPVELQLSTKIQAAWPVQVLQSLQGVRFINTDGVPGVGEKAGGPGQVRSRKLENVVEARILAGLVQILVTGGVPPAEIAVISPFRAQVSVIVHQLRAVMGPDADQVVEVSTIDKYQGKDKDVVLVSFVRCNPENNVGELLTDWRRINVALTRAKQKLILVGSKQTLSAGSSLFHTLLELIATRQWEIPIPATAMYTLDEVASTVRPHCAARMKASRARVEPEPETEPVVVMHQQAGHDIEALVSSGVRIRRNGVSPSRGPRGPITNDIMGEYRGR